MLTTNLHLVMRLERSESILPVLLCLRDMDKDIFPWPVIIVVTVGLNLNLCPNVTTIMTGHGNIRSYLHRLKTIESLECPCKYGIQTVGHLIFQCERLNNERGILKNSVLKKGNWPLSKN